MKKLAVIFLCAAVLALVVADVDDQWLANMYRARAAFRQHGYDLPESRASLQHQPDKPAEAYDSPWSEDEMYRDRVTFQQQGYELPESRASHQQQPIKDAVSQAYESSQDDIYRARAAFRQRGYGLPESRASLQHQPDRSQFHAQAAEKPYDSLEEDILAAVEEVLNKKLYPNQEMASEYHQDKDVDTDLMAEMEARSRFDYSQPLLPRVYQRKLKQGFDTNYFKTKPTGERYHEDNMKEVYRKGFRNVKIRCRPEQFEIEDELKDENYNEQDPYTDNTYFNSFLTKLKKVVEDCIKYRVAPIISWEHHLAEARANDQDRKNYLDFWRKVATELKDMNYHLSFNLFTELGIDYCSVPDNNLDCDESLSRDLSKYTDWTTSVVELIRATGGNNEKRILILGSPSKTADGLKDIDPSIYRNDPYMMVEWHSYAAGPKQRTQPRNNKPDPRNWYGGNETGKDNVRKIFEPAKTFTDETGLLSYFAEWMPQDNQYAALNQEQVISFARFFADYIKKEEIPWSLNVLDVYMDTKNNRWLTEIQDVPSPRRKFTGTPARLNMSLVLDNIIEVM